MNLRASLPLRHPQLLRQLLETLTETEESRAQIRALITAICTEQGVALSEAETNLLESNLVDFFVPPPVSAPAEKGSLREIEAQAVAALEALPEPIGSDARDLVLQVLARYLEGHLISRHEKERLVLRIMAKVYGYGVLEEPLLDEDIAEILVQGIQPFLVIRDGQGELTKIAFDSEADLLRAVDRLFRDMRLRFDDSTNLLSFTAPDGSRVTIAGALSNPSSLIVHIVKDTNARQ